MSPFRNRPSTQALVTIASRAHHLHILKLGLCRNVSTAGIMRAAPQLKHLTRLELQRGEIQDSGIAALAAHCTSLQHLDLVACMKITGACLRDLRSFKQLKFLALAGCKAIKVCFCCG